MSDNIPPKIMEYVHSELPVETFSDNNNLHNINNTISSDDNINKNNTVNSMKNCKKTLFVEPDIPSVAPIAREEFSKIPKYIIGRYTLETVNGLVSSVNTIIKNKYTLVNLGKNGAKKKGELDLFLQFSKEQLSLGPDESKFFVLFLLI